MSSTELRNTLTVPADCLPKPLPTEKSDADPPLVVYAWPESALPHPLDTVRPNASVAADAIADTAT